ncbi:hypothetical protein RDp07_gp17 [Roseobacter phage RD-1410Ws-07]|uniref:Uncharacterized protein n=2 Tax=Sanyabayvirus DS1410Ws06 TaxID=2844087 RepID=A0A191VYP5_9CAUD|nr:hypothetical protein HYO98_gp20 [Dinoroseobacter phage DS-1410Ws-06]ANJ20677.1 hypothetical protein DSp06_gp20 [Dinoroseobacter phage DS-1410Ws-06]ANJ20828.1 hypothetical protein RDp07_gp17 [Roseobacter phage RD-1410Ws-07]
MLVLKLELHSAVTGEVKEIGRTIIANTGKGSFQKGDYIVKVAKKRKTFSNTDTWKEPLRTGNVENYPRLSYNVWRLVIRALLSAFPEEQK